MTHPLTASGPAGSTLGTNPVSSNARVMRWLQTHGMPPAFVGSAPETNRTPPAAVSPGSTDACTQYIRDHVVTGSGRKRTSPGFLMVALGIMFSCLTGEPGPDLSGLLLSHPKSGPLPSSASSGAILTTLTPPRTYTAVDAAWKELRGASDIDTPLLPHVLPRDVKLAALLSQHSYQDEDNTDVVPELIPFRASQAPGFPAFIDSNDEYDQQVYIWLQPSTRTLYVAFRGTQTYADLWHDLDARLLPIDDAHPSIKCHAGIINKYESLRGELEVLVFRNSRKFDKIVCTGHSLGGGLATLAAPNLGKMLPTKKVECITFGSPRVGGKEFNRFYHTFVDQSARIVNENDPVPHLPFWEPFMHVSDAYHITPEGHLVNVPDAPEGLKVFQGLFDIDTDDVAGTHFLDVYMDRVRTVYDKLEQLFARLVGTGEPPTIETSSSTATPPTVVTTESGLLV